MSRRWPGTVEIHTTTWATAHFTDADWAFLREHFPPGRVDVQAQTQTMGPFLVIAAGRQGWGKTIRKAAEAWLAA